MIRRPSNGLLFAFGAPVAVAIIAGAVLAVKQPEPAPKDRRDEIALSIFQMHAISAGYGHCGPASVSQADLSAYAECAQRHMEKELVLSWDEWPASPGCGPVVRIGAGTVEMPRKDAKGACRHAAPVALQSDPCPEGHQGFRDRQGRPSVLWFKDEFGARVAVNGCVDYRMKSEAVTPD